MITSELFRYTMSTTLYRKYRPQKFADLTNQNHVKVTLANEVARGELAHAYLFAGPRGVGKTTTARILAKAINCTIRKSGDGEPCNACPACESVTAGNALDVIEIDAASHTGVDHVREQIIEYARFAPALLAWKVFIIDEVHMLSISAFNALLKTLEEPPPRVLFVLATTELHKVPETVISRCQRFDFHKILVPDLIERLAHLAVEEGVTVDRAVLGEVARAAEGSVRDAESLFGQLLALGDKDIKVETAKLILPHSDLALARSFLDATSRGDVAGAFVIVQQLVQDGVDLPQFTSDCLATVQALLHHALAVGLDASFGLDEEARTFLDRMKERLPLPLVATVMEEFIRLRSAVKEPDAGVLPLEIAAVRLSDLMGKTKAVFLPSAEQGGEKEGGPKPSVTATGPLSLDSITARWQDVVAAVHDGNHSLPLVLVAARPLRIADGIVTLGVSHRFHVSKLLEEKNRRLIESALAKVCGGALRLHAEVASVPSVASDDDPSVRAALDVLGGQVVQ